MKHIEGKNRTKPAQKSITKRMIVSIIGAVINLVTYFRQNKMTEKNKKEIGPSSAKPETIGWLKAEKIVRPTFSGKDFNLEIGDTHDTGHKKSQWH
jgi:hypothetical protein